MDFHIRILFHVIGLTHLKNHFYVRFTRWLSETIAYSYANGRILLNMYFGLFDTKTAFWIMPIANLILILLSPLYGILSHFFGGIVSSSELLPRFPLGAVSLNPFEMFVTFIVFVLSMVILPTLFAPVQVALLLFFLGIYPLFHKESFSLPTNPEHFTNGLKFIMEFFHSKSSLLFALWLVSLVMIAYINLDIYMALLVTGLVVMHFVINYFDSITKKLYDLYNVIFQMKNGMLITIFFVFAIMLLLVNL